ncbi:MAG: tryptophan 2,3-dioxygenase [Saprospiraceae bacterium]|nr:tryptophan 2,3-dioxygenase [Saprospiraceae bacterium]
MAKEVYYKDYLQLNKILNAQETESKDAHDEMLFIVIHQAYELWFKQVLFEVNSVIDLFKKPEILDNSPDLYTVNHRLSRVVTILKVLVQQIDIMETMTPLDFLDFRDLLRPASGFQSVQFKLLEAGLGLKMDDRYGKQYYTSQLRPEDKDVIANYEEEVTLLNLVNKWLERMPFLLENDHWADFETDIDNKEAPHVYWAAYQKAYENSLGVGETQNHKLFKDLFYAKERLEGRNLSPLACRHALFIMLYRDYPMLQMPFQILNTLLEIDEQLSNWRFRHMYMVHRIIGLRVGTGGSSGKGYLKNAMDKHYIFKEIADLTSFLIERKNLPDLPVSLKQRLGFGG